PARSTIPTSASGSRSRSGQAEPEHRPTAGRVLGGDRPAVLRGDLADDGEPEAGTRPSARRRAAEEAVEDVRQLVGRDARPEVAHGQLAAAQAHLDDAVG